MAKSKRIMVVVDPTAESHPAIGRAAWLAKKMGASLHLSVCDCIQYTAGEKMFFDINTLEATRQDLLERQEARLEELAGPLRSHGLNVSVEAHWDHPLHEGILRQIEANAPDLVVKDTHYHPAIKRSVFSNTDWNLMRQCPVPLLLVKPTELGGRVSIVAAVDPMHEHDKPARLDRTILDAAETLCSATDGELHVIHAFDPAGRYVMSAGSMGMAPPIPIEELVESLRTQHTDAMDRLMDDYSVPSENIHLLEGEPRELLVNQAEALHADIVVIGAVARGALKRFVMGSTAEQVLDRIPCDLLIIKPVAGPA
ncbi:MAG: universal stress protein [Gammaproteobacteria bacterium]